MMKPRHQLTQAHDRILQRNAERKSGKLAAERKAREVEQRRIARQQDKNEMARRRREGDEWLRAYYERQAAAERQRVLRHEQAAKAARREAKAMSEAAWRDLFAGHPAANDPMVRIKIGASFKLPVADRILTFAPDAQLLVPRSIAESLVSDGRAMML